MRNEQVPERSGMALAQKGQALAVRRKCDRAVDVANEQLRGAPENRCAIERRESLLGFVAAHAIDIASIERKGEAGVMRVERGNDLSIAHGGDLAEPEGFRAVVLAD